MADLRTLKNTDSEFEGFLRGTFSKNKRAIPLHQRNSQGRREITFELKDLDFVERPSLFLVWWKAIRPTYLTYTLSPMLAALVVMVLSGASLNLMVALSAILSVVLLQVGAHLLNDYYDHLRGTDHVRWRGSQIIQAGWLPAYAVQRASYGVLCASLVAALPVALQAPEVFLALGCVGLIGVLSFSGRRFSLKNRGWGEFSLFVLAGPALMLGFSWVSLGVVSVELVFLGLVFGGMTFFSYFLKNFEELLSEDRSTSNSFAKRLGFDRSQKVALFSLYILPFVFYAYAAVQPDVLSPWLGVGLAVFLVSRSLIKSLKSIDSCLSSTSRKVRRGGLQLHWFLGFIISLSFISFEIGTRINL